MTPSNRLPIAIVGYAFGQFGAVGLLDSMSPLWIHVTIQGLLALVLVSTFLWPTRHRRAVVDFIGAGTVLVGIVVTLHFASADMWVTALALVLTGTTLAYGVHRYERLQLGFIPEDSS